jgi:hypothetical protein
MPSLVVATCLATATETVRHRIVSRLVDGFAEWWQMPSLALALAAVATFVVWSYRRDAVQLPRWPRVALAGLRLGALAAVGVAILDFERLAEHEIVMPSRVAVLVDTSASMTIADGRPPAEDDQAAPESRAAQAAAVLDAGGLLGALAARHDVSVWRFDADAERLAVIPRAGDTEGAAGAEGNAGGAAGDWQAGLEPRGGETRLGEALARAVEDEPPGVLAGVVVLSDGADNSGVDPRASGLRLAKAGVPVHSLGIGSAALPTNVRLAGVAAPARVFPGDRFAVTAYLQPQSLSGRSVRVELAESPADAPDPRPSPSSPPPRTIGSVDVMLGGDGDLVPVRFDVPALEPAGRRRLVVRVVPPPEDRTPEDDSRSVDVEVVDRVTRTLLMAGGPGREFQFMRNVLDRDRSFTADVLPGSAAAGAAPDPRVLTEFPGTDEALGAYDAIVAFDWDWRSLDAGGQQRLERWVARESGGLVLVAGGVFMDAWLSDPRTGPIRDLFPVDLRHSNRLGGDASAAAETPRPLRFTREGADAEFLWLAPGRGASEAAWAGFPGVYACFEAGPPKPGATVYARVDRVAAAATEAQPVYLAGQFYGSGSVLYAGSGELWRLRSLGTGFHERLVTQLVRHVAQGRLLQGSRRGRLLVDRDRFSLGAEVVVRLVLPADRTAGDPPACRARSPEGDVVRVPLAPEAGRPEVLRGSFTAAREGTWQIDVDLPVADDDEPPSRRIQVDLPDRELASPRLDRGLLAELASATGGSSRALVDGGWSTASADELAATIPDRTRREYEAGAADDRFKRRLNTLLLGLAAGLLCLEWIARRLVNLA